MYVFMYQHVCGCVSPTKAFGLMDFHIDIAIKKRSKKRKYKNKKKL